ncbi:MAG: AtpZ/AtpI family protein [Acetobacteraceae bacterium]|nr:AtpZ/AtpI family protein [Acetobacteraceae bacterium]
MNENPDGTGPPRGGEPSFEERLRAARGRKRLDEPPASRGGSAAGGGFGQSPLGIGLRVGVEMVAAMAVAVGIGWALDHWLHTAPLFIALFVLLGGAAGVLNVWRMFAPRPERTPRA